MNEGRRNVLVRISDELLENEIREEIDKTKAQIQAQTGCSPIDAHMQALIRMLTAESGMDPAMT